MKSFGERLDDEAREWVEQDIITEDQREEILSQYEGEDSSKAIRAVLLLGAVMVGLGALLFVGANWSGIPVFGRIAILAGLTGASYYTGWEVKYEREGWDKVGDSFLFIGSVLVGATLFVTAQMFNIEANVHWLLLLWLVAVAPASYAVRSKPTLLLSIVLFGWWSGSYVGGGTVLDVARGFVENVGAYMFYGMTLYGIGRLHEESRFDEFAPTYKMFGPLLLLAMAYIVAVSEFATAQYPGGVVESAFLLAMVSGATATAGLGYYRGKAERKKGTETLWYIGAFAVSVLTVGVSWLLDSTAGSTTVFSGVLLLYHGAFLALTVGTSYMGYRKAATAYVNIGLLFFVLYMGYLYVVRVATYLGTSLGLVLGGVILILGGAYLEKRRRELLEGMEGDPSWT